LTASQIVRPWSCAFSNVPVITHPLGDSASMKTFERISADDRLAVRGRSHDELRVAPYVAVCVDGRRPRSLPGHLDREAAVFVDVVERHERPGSLGRARGRRCGDDDCHRAGESDDCEPRIAASFGRR
jgi:hypothetical protein